MIARRAFVRSLTCSLICVPLGTYGQTAGKVYRLGQLRQGAVPLSRARVSLSPTGVVHAASTTDFSDQWLVASEPGWGGSVQQQAFPE